MEDSVTSFAIRQFMHVKGPYVQLIIGKFQNY
jgi:hypothetical protein